MKRKKELVKEELNARNMKECTFAPQIIRSGDGSRKFDDFLQDQSKFNQRRLDNIARIAEDSKAKTQPQIDPHPQIDPNSVALLEAKRGQERIFERLYALSKKTIPAPLSASKPAPGPSTAAGPRPGPRPTAGPPSERREVRLYADAERLQKKKQAQAEERKAKPRPPLKKPGATDPLVEQAYRKEYAAALADAGVPAEEGELTYEQLRTLHSDRT